MPEITGELKTVLTAAAFAPIPDRAFLRITGPDAPRWLNGMVTNSIQTLSPGEGNYNFLLNAQGRIQGDCTIYRDPEAKEPVYILETDRTQTDVIQQLLDKFIIMDDVELTPLESFTHVLHLIGQTAPGILRRLDLFSQAKTEAALGPLQLSYGQSTSQQITAPGGGFVPRFYIALTGEDQLERLLAQLRSLSVPEISPAALDQLRILEARPRYGTDIRNTETAKDLPQETNQSQALHFAKGCYLGQEIVERIRSRGQVHRLFTPFRLEGASPQLPTVLEANGKMAGELTSATEIQTDAGPVWLALGYARREALDTRAQFTFAGGTAHPRAAGTIA